MASSSAATATATSTSSPGHDTDHKSFEEMGEEQSLTGLLSDDILLRIMRCFSTRELLSSLAFVCCRWLRLCDVISICELVPDPLNPSSWPWGTRGRRWLLSIAIDHARTLERVHLHGLQRFTSKDVIALCQSLPKLRELSIIKCPSIETIDLELIASHLPSQLISLDISCKVDDKISAVIHQSCPLLQKLDLRVSSGITRQGLDGLLQTCKSLTALDLGSYLLGWREVAELFKCCKSLCHLSLVSELLSVATYPDVSGVTGEMPKLLTSIRLYSTYDRSVAVDFLPMFEMLRSNGHQLKQLHAQGLGGTSWQIIPVLCANLKLLDLLAGPPRHWRDPLLRINDDIALCGLIKLSKKLERIALPSATDRVLIELGRVGSNLREIRFWHTKKDENVTDRGVVAVAEGCPELRVLSLSGCHKLTISSARALGFHCRKLEVLILTGCAKFTDTAVGELLPRLNSSLICIDLIGCQITQSTLEAVLQHAKVTSLRVVAIDKSLWYRSQSVIADIHGSNPRLRIKKRSFTWDGFYHGRAFF